MALDGVAEPGAFAQALTAGPARFATMRLNGEEIERDLRRYSDVE
ncbi:MAG: hypothetical protein O7A06_13715 [Acidobacteria bacterium]|nr:hypothetical protein [Acidobacteriota bacterium]MCZ6751134.1 hypothetical protein [Acidobacteriota bacterium]